MNDIKEPEFSYSINLSELGKSEKHVKLEADEGQCKALAKRFSISSLGGFRAEMTLKDDGYSKGVALKGHFSALIGNEDQEGCFEELFEDLNIRFLPEERITPELEEENMMTLDSEDLEPLPEGPLDLGELVSQYLALSLDPFLLDDISAEEIEKLSGVTLNEPPIKKENPFAVLTDLKSTDLKKS